MYEQAVLDVNRVTPALHVLDPAVVPDRKARPKRSLIVLGAAFGAFMFASLFVLLRHKYYIMRQQNPEIFMS
jgi:uncharacterized protein involved in exopolysaccharide biosynthesis